MSNSLKKKHSFIYTYIHSTNIEKTLLFSIDKNKHLGFFFCLTTKKRHGLKDLCVFFYVNAWLCVLFFWRSANAAFFFVSFSSLNGAYLFVACSYVSFTIISLHGTKKSTNSLIGLFLFVHCSRYSSFSLLDLVRSIALSPSDCVFNVFFFFEFICCFACAIVVHTMHIYQNKTYACLSIMNVIRHTRI